MCSSDLATGGVAFTNYKFSATQIPPAIIPGTATWGGGARTGWNLGVGAEYALTNNWSIGAEWKYYNFGTKNGACASGVAGLCANYGFFGPATVRTNFRETENALTARVNYRF